MQIVDLTPDVINAVRQHLNSEECLNHGHDFEHAVDVKGDPVQVLCGRCGRFWSVVESAPPVFPGGH